MADNPLLTREEVPGGPPTKRAAALMFLIESRTAHLVERARHTMEPFQSEEAVRERELALVEAFALGREPPMPPSIQDLERHAPQWADLVPENPRLRATVGRLLGQKYQFAESDVPALRAVLGLDDEEVQQAHQHLYGEALHTIFAARPGLTCRLRWGRATCGCWLESLPPFWMAFALTLTETVGASVLALPIALADVGPLPGIILLLLLGLVNVITVAWMAEAAARTASIRYGGAYFGRLVAEYLGGAAALLVTVALVVISAMALMAFSIGLSTTLASATNVTAFVWMAVLFATVGYFVSRDSIGSTFASALAIGAVNLVLVAVLAGLGFAHLRADNLRHIQVPGIGGESFELGFLGLIFGVILCSYFGHTSVGNCAAVVLQRDPSARSLIWGVVAAQICAITIYIIWVLGINGAVAPDALSGQDGTVLEPLANVAGPAVYVAGSIFAVLAMGMGSVHMALGLVNVVRERLPRREQPVMMLRRDQCRLVFTPRGDVTGRGPRLDLTYLGLVDETPQFRLQAHVDGHTERVDKTSADRWTASETIHQVPVDEIDLAVETISADEGQVRLKVMSAMQMNYEGAWIARGLDLASVLENGAGDPDADSDVSLLRWMLGQREVSVEAVAAFAGQDVHETTKRLQTLGECGSIREVARNGTITWRANVARRRDHQVPELLERAITEPARSSPWASVRDRLRQWPVRIGGLYGRRMIEYSPLVIIFVFAEWLVLTDRASFTSVLSYVGVIAVPIFAGLVPCLLLVSSRRKGDLVPGIAPGALGRAWLVTVVYALFLAGILLHGLVIWQQPAERMATLAVSIIMVGVTVLAIRRGAFTPRTVVVLRDDQRPGGNAALGIVSVGHAVVTETELGYTGGVTHVRGDTVQVPNFASVRRIRTELPEVGAPDVKIWANRITPDGALESLAANVSLTCSVEPGQLDLRLAGGNAQMSGDGGPCAIEITFDAARSSLVSSSNEDRQHKQRPPVDMDSLLSTETFESGTIPAKRD